MSDPHTADIDHQDDRCEWGDHDTKPAGQTPNGVLICAACVPLSGLRLSPDPGGATPRS